MALRYAVANGNWSALATWDGGASLPGAGDDVYANGKTVTIDKDVAVLSVRTTAGAPAVAGGGFTLQTGRTLTGNVYAGSSTCVTISAASASCTINGNIYGSSTTNSVYGVNITGTPASLTVNGNISGGTFAGATGAIGVYSNVNATTLNVTGNLTGFIAPAVSLASTNSVASVTGNLFGSATQNALSMAGSGATCTVVGGLNPGVTSGVGYALGMSSGTAGNCTVSGGAMGFQPINYNGSRVVNLTPTNTSSCGPGFIMSGSGVMNGIGNVTATTQHGIQNTGTGTTNWVGNVVGSFTNSACIGVVVLNGTFNLTGNVTGTQNTAAISSPGAYVYGATAVLNVTGDVFGAKNAATQSGWGGHSAGITVNSGSVNVYGTAYASEYSHGVLVAAPTYLTACPTFVQVCKANDWPNSPAVNICYGVSVSNNGSFTADAIEDGAGGVPGTASRCFIRDAGSNFVKMRQSNNGAITVMGEVANDYPLPANVRSGVTYDFGAKTGTCAVPPAGSVALGVPVDATTGTAVLGGGSSLTAADVWSHATRSLTDKADFALTASYDPAKTAAPTAAANAAAVRTELATELGRIDQPVSAAKTLTGAYDAAKTAASSSDLAAAVAYILSNLPAGITPADIWTHATRSLTQDVGLSPALTARLENCATVQSTGDQLAAMGV